MKKAYFANQVFDGNRILENQYVVVENGKIVSVSQQQPNIAATTLTGLLCPGFIDVQVNGGGGVLFNNSPDIATLGSMTAAHQRFGTTSLFPTLITDKFSVMSEAADSITKALSAFQSKILGIHFEGPHLSVPKKGIHPDSHIRPVSDQELGLFCRKDIGQVIVTLAPENVQPDVIRDLVNQNVIVCLGHSNADSDTVFAALEAGATGFTHLYNAMSPLTSRAPGMVGAALADKHSYCGLIVDMHHVDKVACKVAINAKTPEKIMLVTDAMSHVGSNQQTLKYCGTQIVRDGDKLTIPDGTLAGSALDMTTAVRNCFQRLGLPLETALKMATSTPAKFLNREAQLGHIREGAEANLLLLNDDLQVQKSWIAGQEQLQA